MNIIEIDNMSEINFDENESKPYNITEQMYIDMSNDFKDRMKKKNKIIHDLQIKLIIVYALVERFMDTGDEAFIDETRLILDKSLIDEIGIQEIE